MKETRIMFIALVLIVFLGWMTFNMVLSGKFANTTTVHEMKYDGHTISFVDNGKTIKIEVDENQLLSGNVVYSENDKEFLMLMYEGNLQGSEGLIEPIDTFITEWGGKFYVHNLNLNEDYFIDNEKYTVIIEGENNGSEYVDTNKINEYVLTLSQTIAPGNTNSFYDNIKYSATIIEPILYFKNKFGYFQETSYRYEVGIYNKELVLCTIHEDKEEIIEYWYTLTQQQVTELKQVIQNSIK